MDDEGPLQKNPGGGGVAGILADRDTTPGPTAPSVVAPPRRSVDLELLHIVELSRARLLGTRPLSPAQLVELADFIAGLQDNDPEGWVDRLVEDADARAAADVGDDEPDHLDTRDAAPSGDTTRDQAPQPATRAAGPAQTGDARRGTASPLHSPGVGYSQQV